MNREQIGKYRIVGELGRGTMGQVYKAHDPVLKRDVALKTIEVALSPGDETLQRFQREAQAAALLNHPNIVTVHDFGEERGLLYMAMELLVGLDLRDAIDSDLLKALGERLDVVDGILAALDYAHAKGVVHRDVKPANVHLVGPWGSGPDVPGRQVKIMDFGLARVSTSEMTQEGIVLGTPNYMSPEQALGDKVDGRSDIFSTGAVLYELLTGHKPFEADTTPSVLFQVVHREPPPVRRWAPETPNAIVAVVSRALEKDREKRFASAGDMRTAIAVARQALAGTPVMTPRPAAPPPRPPGLRPPPLPPTAAPPVRPDPSYHGVPPLPPVPRVPPGEPGLAGRDASSTLPPAGPARSFRPGSPLVAGAAVAALLLAVVLVAQWVRGRSPAGVPQPAASGPAVDALTQELVRKQVQLARRELENKNYAAATTEAQGVLKLDGSNAEATEILRAARERTAELDQSIAESRRRLEAGDIEAASQELSHLLEIDPRHPAAVELSARLNTAFRAQADEAAASMREARSGALGAGVTAWSLRSLDASVSQADLLLEQGEFADATRLYLEARDAFDRARREAATRRPPTPTPTPARADSGQAGSGAPASASRPAATAGRSFTQEGTSVAAGGSEGSDSRAAQFTGRMEFEVLPLKVQPGQPFVVRIHLRNDGRRAVKIRSVDVAAVVDGRRVLAPVTPLQREVGPQWRALVAEYSGVWTDARSWALEAVVTADRDEKIASRLRAN